MNTSTLALVQAARHSAVASAKVLEVLEQSLVQGETESVLGGLVEALGKAHIIKIGGGEDKVSDSTANAGQASDVAQTTDTAQAAAPAVAEDAATAKAPIEILNEMLNGEYDLRSVASMTQKTGLSRDAIIELLDDNDVDYVTKTRRSDRAELIGLSSRN
jgi:hypothetical protein